MNIRRFSFTILKKEKSHNLFYMLFLIVSITFMTLFINIITDEMILPPTMNLDGIATGICMISLVIVVVIGFYAYNYFLAIKLKLIGIFKLSGTYITSMLQFLFTQTFSLYLVCIPIGILLGTGGSIIFSKFVYQISGVSYPGFQISLKATIYTLVIVLVQAFYLAVMAYGFIHRHEIKTLLGYQQSKEHGEEAHYLNFNFEIPSWLFVIIFVGALFLLATSKNLVENFLVYGNVVLIVCIGKIIDKFIPKINSYLRKQKCITDKINLITLANLDVTLSRCAMLLQVLSFGLLFTICYITAYAKSPGDLTLMYVVYLMIIIVLSLSIMYQVLMESRTRNKSFKQLAKIGYTKKEITSVIAKEVFLFYLLIVFLSTIYPITALILFVSSKIISAFLAIQLITFFLFVMFVTGIIVYQNYKNMIYQEIE